MERQTRENELSAPAARPEGVRDAVLILYTCAGIGMAFSVISAGTLADIALSGKASVVYLQWLSYLNAAYLCAMAYLLGRGRNWARHAFFGFYALTLPVLAVLIPKVLDDAMGFAVNCLFIALLEAVAVVFLTRRDVVSWFRKREEHPSA